MPDACHAAVFPARRDAFVSLRAFVEQTCAGVGIPHGECLRLMLLIEELFVNTVEHGHGGDSEAPVRLALTVSPTAIAVTYEDTARPFDPLAAPPPPPAESVDDRPVGGLGITLVTTMADEVGYVRLPDANRISFRVTRGR